MSVVITGASSGIGEACAWEFAKAGRGLILMARRREKLQLLAKSISEKYRVTVTPVVLDVRDKTGVARWVDEEAALAKSVEVLVNNAGLARGFEPLAAGNPDDWDEMIDTNIKGLLYMTRAFLPGLIEKKGHIVNMGSIAGAWTYPNGNVYCATKYAVRALTESLRLDVHGTGVRVTEISPGMVETDFSDVRFKGDKDRAKKVYAGTRPLMPVDIAEAVVWSVLRPKHVNIQELVIFPTDQASVTMVKRE